MFFKHLKSQQQAFNVCAKYVNMKRHKNPLEVIQLANKSQANG